MIEYKSLLYLITNPFLMSAVFAIFCLFSDSNK
jgi:hypothetical protein